MIPGPSHPPAAPPRHLTTRRSFVAVSGFAMLALYAVWAAYESEPTVEGENVSAGGGHGGGGGITPEEFRKLTLAFIAAHRLPDGSVRPGMPTAMAPGDGPGRAPPPADEHAGHGAPAPVDEHAGHGAPAPVGENAGHDMGDSHEPVDVYMMASRFAFEPDLLRLEARQPYRLRLMAMDTAHGASIHLGTGARMIRGPARTVIEQTLTFAKPGEYLLYCTMFCGDGHDLMTGRILVS